MNVALWIVTGLLAAAYLAGGAFKVVLPKQRVAASRGGGWADDFGAGTVKAIGGLEVLAAIGLVLPALLGVAPVLVPLAALGLVLVMVGAALTRLRRREYLFLGADLVYLAAAAFVAWGRLGPAPLAG